MGATRVGRRKFIKTGGTVAAGTLLVVGGGVWAASGPTVELPEPSYPGEGDLSTKVLVAFASKAGSTAEVAGRIGEQLSAKGLLVDVRRASHVRSVAGYDAVIVGSAVRAGKWLPEASGFVESQRGALAGLKTAFFTVCMSLHEDTPASREAVKQYLRPVRQILKPQATAFFAGKMDYGRLAFVPRLIVKTMKIPEGDFRNWSAIGDWAETLQREVLAPRPLSS